MKKPELNDIVKQKGEYIHFFTSGKWSSHDLLYELLHKSGKADLFITSYSISEYSIRTILKAIDENLINSITLFINTSAKKHKLHLLLFAQNVCTVVYLANIHFKLFLIKNNDFSIVVNQSANFMNNRTYEAGVICYKEDIYKLYHDYIIQNLIPISILFNDGIIN